MTLVIAGRNLKKGVFSKKVSDFEEGLFAVADTNITSDNTVLVSGFKKVYEIPVRLKKPNFCDEWFNGYSGYILEKNCFIAFAGSSLVAQHLMNSIRNHLGDIYPTYESGAKVKVNEIGSDDVAVIGMRKKYASDARVTYKAAIASGETTSSRMHSFLSDAIDCENANGSNRIGKPCGLYLLSGGRLNLEKMLR